MMTTCVRHSARLTVGLAVALASLASVAYALPLPCPLVYYDFNTDSSTTAANRALGSPIGDGTVLGNTPDGHLSDGTPDNDGWAPSGSGFDGSGFFVFDRDAVDEDRIETGLAPQPYGIGTTARNDTTPQGEYTMAAWVRIDYLGGDEGDGMIFGQAPQQGVLHNGRRGTNYYQGHWNYDSSAPGASVGPWNHLVWVFRAEEHWASHPLWSCQKLHVNGVLQYDQPLAGFLDPSDILVGACRLPTDHSHRGALDEVGIWNLALTSLADGSGDVPVGASAEVGSEIWRLYRRGGREFVVPEPATLTLLALGGLGLLRKRRRVTRDA